MSVKLLLNPAAAAQACLHAETGITFMIRAISPEKYDEIRRASLNKDKNLELTKWGANFAVAAIEGWGEEVGDENGPAACNEDNLRIFGSQQAVNIMPWVIERATSVDQFRLAEVGAAKKG